MATKTRKCCILPLLDQVLVRRLDADKTTKGGIVLADNRQKNHRAICKGEVVAIGPGRMTEMGTIVCVPKDVKVGSRVYYQEYGGSPVDEYDTDEELYFIQASHLLGVIEE